MKHNFATAIVALHPNAEFFCTDEYSSIEWDSSNSESKPTEEVLTAKIAELDEAEAKKLLRVERNELLRLCDWVVVRAQETSTAVPSEWVTYRQQLRDLPATADPKLGSDYELDYSSFTWPTKPS